MCLSAIYATFGHKTRLSNYNYNYMINSHFEFLKNNLGN